MVALRSRRLEALLGAPLDELRYEHLETLVTNHVPEAFDLDFKAQLYGSSERDRKDLATDVAALANTAGGLLILGIGEDRQARAVAAPGVPVSDDEIRRILQIVGSLVVPLPVFEPLPFEKPGEAGHGFLVVAVVRSPLAPHAVIVNQGLRYPRRNGTTTRYLSEPEVASAYRERLAGAQRQAARVEEIEGEALGRLDTSGLPWVVVSLVPDMPGDISITGEVFATFRRHIMSEPATVVDTAIRALRVSVGRRRLLADGTMDDSLLAKWISFELHTDGSGVFSMCILDLRQGRPGESLGEDGPRPQLLQDEGIVIAVMSGLLQLAQHARGRAAAGGNALVRVHVFPVSAMRPTGLGHNRFHGFPDSRGAPALITQPPVAETAAALDDLAQPCPGLISASALLVDEIGQAFGVPEMGQLSRDGQLRRRYWGNPQMITWAEQHGIEVTDDAIA
jgi:Schlafen, AlbA_2